MASPGNPRQYYLCGQHTFSVKRVFARLGGTLGGAFVVVAPPRIAAVHVRWERRVNNGRIDCSCEVDRSLRRARSVAGRYSRSSADGR
jgi:hypothetical protein